MFRTALSIAALTIAASAAQAATETLDFEEFDANTRVTEVWVGGVRGEVFIVGRAAQIAATTGYAVTLDSEDAFDPLNPADGDPDLASPFYDAFDGPGTPAADANVLNPGNVLVIEEDPDFDSAADNYADDSALGGRIIFQFESAVNFLGFDVLDDVTNMIVRGFDGPEGDRERVGQMVINQEYDNQFGTYDAVWEDINRLSFNFRRYSGAIDNLRFEVAPVPVPATLPLMVAGLAGFGLMRRRRKG